MTPSQHLTIVDDRVKMELEQVGSDLRGEVVDGHDATSAALIREDVELGEASALVDQTYEL